MKVSLNGKDPEELQLEAAVQHFFGAESLSFIGGGKEDKHTALSVADYPMAFFHWDVFGDIASRLSSSRAHSLVKVILRTKSAEESENMKSSNAGINLAESFEEDGNFKLYHYTVVFTGDMNSVRDVIKSFDTAWKGDKNGNGRRMYIVRSLALYATENGAVKVIESAMEEDKKEQQSSQRDDQPRRRRRRRVVTEAVADSGNTQSEFKSSSDLSDKEARARYYDVMLRMKKEEDEKKNPKPAVEAKAVYNADGTYADGQEKREEKQLSQEEKEALYDKLEAKLPENLRFGYGQVVIGNHSDDCLVYLDIDYVVLEQK
jgi:hypothetical protein